ADLRGGSAAHPASGAGGHRAAQTFRLVRGGRAGTGVGRPVRLLQWGGGGGRRRPLAPQGCRLDFRSTDSGRAGDGAGGEAVDRRQTTDDRLNRGGTTDQEAK